MGGARSYARMDQRLLEYYHPPFRIALETVVAALVSQTKSNNQFGPLLSERSSLAMALKVSVLRA